MSISMIISTTYCYLIVYIKIKTTAIRSRAIKVVFIRILQVVIFYMSIFDVTSTGHSLQRAQYFSRSQLFLWTPEVQRAGFTLINQKYGTIVCLFLDKSHKNSRTVSHRVSGDILKGSLLG